MARMFQTSHGFVSAPAPPPPQSPPLSTGFVLPPGPRPRPVGGDDTSPGYTPDTVAMAQQQRNNDKDNTDLVIGSWNEECEKDNATGM